MACQQPDKLSRGATKKCKQMLQHLLAPMCSSSGRCVQVAKILPSGVELQSADQLKGNSPFNLPFMEGMTSATQRQVTIQLALHHHSTCPSSPFNLPFTEGQLNGKSPFNLPFMEGMTRATPRQLTIQLALHRRIIKDNSKAIHPSWKATHHSTCPSWRG